MNTENFLPKYKNEILNELNEYYDSICSELDKKKQLLIQNDGDVQSLTSNHQIGSIENEYTTLIDQINRVSKSNLNDVINYFDNLDQDNYLNEHDELKEDLKRDALKSYLIMIGLNNQSDNERWGLLLEFEWYIDKKEQKFIEFVFYIY